MAALCRLVSWNSTMPARAKVEQRRGRGDPRKPEEWRDRLRLVFPVQHAVDGGDAAVDLRLRRARGDPAEEGVRPRMVRDRVPFGELAAQNVRMSKCVAAEAEERRPDAFGSQGIEDLRGRAGPGSVVEGEHDFPVVERKRGG